MARVSIYMLFITGCLFVSGCKKSEAAAGDTTFPVRLSFTKNPADIWQVGYSASDTLDVLQMQPCTVTDTSNAIAFWHPASGTTGYYPYTGQNRDTAAKLDISRQWALRPGEVAMEGSNNGQFSLLRFIPPIAGTYRVKVVFEGVHFGLSSTDVHVLLNKKALFDAIIEGYGGDPYFHEITGARPTATYEATLVLQKGDFITFAVGYGTNKNHYNDTTGLIIRIERV